MSYTRFTLIVCSLALIISACTTVHSVVDKNFHKTISKVYIQMDPEAGLGQEYRAEMGKALQEGFAARSITSVVKSTAYIANLVTPDTSSVASSNFEPDVVLVVGGSVTVRNSMYGGYTGTDGTKLKLSLFELGGEKPVWKANVSVNTGGFGEGGGATSVDEILKRMQKDGLIPAPKDTSSTKGN